MVAPMMVRFIAVVVLTLAASLAHAHAQVVERRPNPVVVELYTSQGCWHCPRANRLLGEFSREARVLALTFSVGYWDYLGWSDTFAQPLFTDRQREFSRRMRSRGLITPQLVFDGQRQVSASDWDQARAVLEEVLAHPQPAGAPEIVLQRLPGARVRVAVVGGANSGAPADIWLIGYDPGPVTVSVTGGENARRRVTHFNLVQTLERVGQWSGAPIYLERERCRPQCAAIVQQERGGRILAAAATQPVATD